MATLVVYHELHSQSVLGEGLRLASGGQKRAARRAGMAAPDPLKANEHMKTEYQLSVLLDKVMAGGCRLLLQLVVEWAHVARQVTGVRKCEHACEA
jgi:hypothetical protein